MVDIDRLKELALAATKGEWKVRTHPRLPSFVQAPKEQKDHGYDIEILGEDEAQYSTREQDVNYIAAANPLVLLELIGEVEEWRLQSALANATVVPGSFKVTHSKINVPEGCTFTLNDLSNGDLP